MKYNGVAPISLTGADGSGFKFLALFMLGFIPSSCAAETPQEQSIELALPVACDMEKHCSIHKYVDLDPGVNRLDYACGSLSSDGHTGTDFRVPNLARMHKGVDVIAAADGVVRAVRDGVRDISVREGGVEAVKDIKAGNSVALTHPNGWETQYSHLKKGSVRVQPGDHVKVGDILGQIGLSGNTEFPHTHFSVRHDGRNIDPFTGMAVDTELESHTPDPDKTEALGVCGDTSKSLWNVNALAALPYKASGILTAGFATGPATAEAARNGQYDRVKVHQQSPALVFWVDLFGSEAGDTQEFTIQTEDGTPIHTRKSRLEKNNISWFAFSGKKRPKSGWPKGPYIGSYRLIRDGRIVSTVEKQLIIEK